MTNERKKSKDDINGQVFQPVIIRRSTPTREVMDKKTTELYERMKSEKERLATFVNWPLSFISPRELAKYGFYYIGEKDRVKCPFCKGTVMEWQEGDLPLNEHRKHFPRCPFLVGYNVGNVPIDVDPIRSLNGEMGHDVCGVHFRLVTRNINMNSGSKVHSLPTSGNAKSVASGTPSGPKNTDYVTMNSRLKSFEENWPKSSPVKPQQLAEAGFFHIGVDDYVKCFYCDGGLCHWEKEDEPWEEHMKWFPDCEFIRLMKNDVTTGKATIVSSTTNNPEMKATSFKPPGKTTPTPASVSKPSANVETIQVEPTTLQKRDVVTINSSSTSTTLPQSNTSVKPNTDLSIVEKPVTEIPNDSKTSDTSTTKPSLSTTTCTETCTTEASNHLTTMINENNKNSTNSVATFTQNTTCSEPNSKSSVTTLEQKKSEKSSEKSNSSTSENSKDERPTNSSSNIINTSNIIPSEITSDISDDDISNCQSDEDSALASGTSSPQDYSPPNSPPNSPSSMSTVTSESNGLICKICLDLDVNIVFVPCMHAISCAGCSLGISQCPICRSSIIERKRLYFS